MTVPLKPIARWVALALIGASVIPASHGQPTELIELETITIGQSGPVTFVFADHGTGGTGYTVQSTAAIEDPVQWGTEPGAFVESLGNGQYQVTVAKATPDRFYRVISANGDGSPIQIGFATTEFKVNEGGNVSPTITFSRPYFGTIRYSIDGNAGPGDYSSLSGEVQVSGTSVVIPITLSENTDIDEIKQLVLILESGSGAEAGASASATITIGENDSIWHGALFDSAATLGFSIRIRNGVGGAEATLVSDGIGVIPAGEFSAAIAYSDTVFSFLSSDVNLDPSTTVQGLSAVVKLDLDAQDGQPNEVVEEGEIRGLGKLIVQYPGNDHLNRTNAGAFLLLPQPVAPSLEPLQLLGQQ